MDKKDKKLFKIYLIKTTDSGEGLVLCDRMIGI